MRVALVHDWLVTARGGERVLEALCRMFPDADLFTLLHQRGSQSPLIEQRRITASFLDRLPGVYARYRHLLPLMPAAIESLRLEGYGLVLSSSHCVAKGVRVPEGARHLSYVHAPMRYMWDLFDDYFGPGRAPVAVRWAARAARPALRAWDRASAQRPDALVANSHHVAGKVKAFWGREAEVVHPPVELSRFTAAPPGEGRGGYFLWLGALAPYKRVDLALEAFRRTGLPLWVAGDGQDAARLRRELPPNVKLLGKVADADVPTLYRDARALVFPGEEDFGITPLEAQASGRPVIALGRGGALETVTARTGLFFTEQTAEGLVEAVRRFESSFEPGFQPSEARAHAERFSPAAFEAGIRAQLARWGM
jgi:glycosyltransferase involved in cell wall biosynthesis